jgi:hypothetical protein
MPVEKEDGSFYRLNCVKIVYYYYYYYYFNVVLYYSMTLKNILNNLYIFNFRLDCILTVNIAALIMFVYLFSKPIQF